MRGVVDSAFAAAKEDYFIVSAQTPPAHGGAEETLIFNEATSVRQLSEWGMRTLQGGFPRVKDRFYYEERGERQVVVEMIVRLLNIRAGLVGVNQIKSTFMPCLDMPTHVALNIPKENF